MQVSVSVVVSDGANAFGTVLTLCDSGIELLYVIDWLFPSLAAEAPAPDDETDPDADVAVVVSAQLGECRTIAALARTANFKYFMTKLR